MWKGEEPNDQDSFQPQSQSRDSGDVRTSHTTWGLLPGDAQGGNQGVMVGNYPEMKWVWPAEPSLAWEMIPFCFQIADESCELPGERTTCRVGLEQGIGGDEGASSPPQLLRKGSF